VRPSGGGLFTIKGFFMRDLMGPQSSARKIYRTSEKGDPPQMEKKILLQQSQSGSKYFANGETEYYCSA